jgi:hypothetical protein
MADSPDVIILGCVAFDCGDAPAVPPSSGVTDSY